MKGIMFKEDLFRKVITGEKTETRRVVKMKPGKVFLPHNYQPRYRPGEVVYLKEPYFTGVGEKTFYRYIKPGLSNFDGWKSKMFMPASAARYFIRIKSVEGERLRDISMRSVIAEGCDIPTVTHSVKWQDNWIELWNSINKPPYTWEDNPWVWVYRFELTEKPSTND